MSRLKTSIDISDTAVKNSILNKLPAYRNSEDDSNNQKVLNIVADIFNEQKNNIFSINDLRKINNATGQVLTDIANDYSVNRIDDDDEFLRFQIKWQILKANAVTNMNGLKKLISVLLNISLSVFDIKSTDRPREIEIVNIPFDFNSGSHNDLKRKILSDSIQSVLPVGWKLKDIQYSKSSSGNMYYAIYNTQTIFKHMQVLHHFSKSKQAYRNNYYAIGSTKSFLKERKMLNGNL